MKSPETIESQGFSLDLLECQEADLNRRHEDFQSSALPTELSRHGRYALYFRSALK